MCLAHCYKSPSSSSSLTPRPPPPQLNLCLCGFYFYVIWETEVGQKSWVNRTQTYRREKNNFPSSLLHSSFTPNYMNANLVLHDRNNTLKLLFILNWRIIVLQYYVGFCHVATCISHRYTYVPSILNLPSTSQPISPL